MPINPFPQQVLDECAREPIHIPGGIQAFGVLLALDADLCVRQCSANVGEVLGHPPEVVLGKPLHALLGDGAGARIRAAFADLHEGTHEELGDIDAACLPPATNAFAHLHDGVRILEFLPTGGELASTSMPVRGSEQPAGELRTPEPQARLFQKIATGVKADTPIDVFCDLAVKHVRILTGYDRVMVYRFDAAANGEVIAEARRGDIESYLGLWYPASDIPAQARELYKRSLVRGLADAQAAPVALVPLVNPVTGRDLDLSHCALRAMSPIHCEYLINMGVRATLVASVLVDGQLWGLLVCHHAEPLIPGSRAIGLVGGMAELLAAHATLSQHREWARAMLRGQELLQRFPTLIDHKGDWAARLVSPEAAVMEVMQANGFAVLHAGRVFRRGLTPADADLRRIGAWLEEQNISLLVTDQLGIDEPAFVELSAVASGLLALRVPHTDGGWALWLRPEVAVTVRWAGDPRKELVRQGSAQRLTPRKSFEEWLTRTRHQSRAWTFAEQVIAGDTMRMNLLDVLAAWQRAQIHDLQKYFRIMFEQVNDAVIVVDRDGSVTFWNNAATGLYGWTSEEMVGEAALAGSTAAHLRELERILAEVRARGEVLEEHQARRKDGSQIWVHARGQPLRGVDGALFGFVIIARDISDRRQREAELRLMQAVVTNTPDSILITESEPIDEPGPRIIYGNPAFFRDTGFGLDEVLGKTPRILQRPSSDRGPLDRIRASLKQWKPIRVELINHRKNGEEFWSELDITPIADETGWCTHWISVQRDVTERVMAQQALRESEERFRLIFENAAAGIARVSIGGRFFEVNDTWCRFLGYSREELLLASVPLVTHPDDLETDLAQVGRVLAGEISTYTMETRLLRSDGAVIWVNLAVALCRDSAGAPRYFIRTVQDITERKRAEAELRLSKQEILALNAELERRVEDRTAQLRRSEERFRLIAETIQDVFWMSMPVTREIIYVSPAYEKIWGRTCQSLHDEPRSFREGIHPEDRARAAAAWAKDTQGEIEYRLLTPDGTLRWIRVREYRIHDAEGRLALYVGTASDITQRVLAEEAVRERSEELVRVNAALAKASRMKDEFLASMSHELRTPLNGVLSMAEALQERVYGPITLDQASALRDIEQSGRHLLALINDILDLSKIEAGQVVLELGPTSVEGVCQASMRLIRELAQKKRLRTTVSIDGSVSTILADERRLKQILVNLLSNAVKFTLEGGSIGLEVTGDQASATVTFTVWDTGIGIRPENIGLLFRPFQQIDARLSREYSGTGLGLALVARMTALHGGSVAVESEPAKGSRFTVKIPWEEVDPGGDELLEPESAAWAAAALEGRQAAVGVTRVVLVADDNMINACSVADFLKVAGYRVVLAADGQQAVEKARALLPDVILMDLQMPGTDGLEATRQLRADPATRAIPIVAVTALAMPGDRERCLSAGVTDYLAKPLSLRLLRDVVARLLAMRGAG